MRLIASLVTAFALCAGAYLAFHGISTTVTVTCTESTYNGQVYANDCTAP
jgi:hypothetical protein